MGRAAKFYIVCVFCVVALVGQIVYFSTKDYHIDSKLNFIKATGMTSFAFNTQTTYQRHPNLQGINQIQTSHPSFRESDMASFINTGKKIR